MLIAEGLEFLRIYWVMGTSPKTHQLRNEVTSPPVSGWATAFVMRGEKRSTIFCPHSMTSYNVSNKSLEIAGAEEPKTFVQENIVALINVNWAQYQSYGWQRDYDTCAIVLKKLGAPVPEQVMRGGEEDTRKKGGKEVAKALAKPVKREGKRGQFLQWFLEADGSRSVREAMAHFSMSRSNALSYLFMLKKDHGIGYELVGDTATVVLPEGCVDPFTSQEEQDRAQHNACAEDTVLRAQPPAMDDDGWLDGPAEEPAKEAVDDDSWLD